MLKEINTEDCEGQTGSRQTNSETITNIQEKALDYRNEAENKCEDVPGKVKPEDRKGQ